VRSTTKGENRKPLISLMILKITGQVLQNLYIPEYAKPMGPPSFAQSYPQKWWPVGGTPRLASGVPGVHR
jgi:hypothetical protein